MRFLFCLLLTVNFFAAFSQKKTIDLLGALKAAQQQSNYLTDTGNVALLNKLAHQYLYENADSSLFYAKKALSLAQSQNFMAGQARSWHSMGRAYYVIGNYDLSLDAANRLMVISNKINYLSGVGGAYQITGLIYLEQNKYSESIANLNKSLDLFNHLGDNGQIGRSFFNLAICYDDLGKSAKAFYYVNKAIAAADIVKDTTLLSMAQNRAGEIYYHLKDYKKALAYYQQVADGKSTTKWERDFALSGIALCNYDLGKYREAIAAAQKSYRLSRQVNSASDALRALGVLSESYAAVKDYRNAYEYQVQFRKLNDSAFNSEREKEINYLHLKQQQADNKRLESEVKNKEAELSFRSKLLFFRNIIAAATIVFVIYIIVSNRQKTFLNKMLKEQNEEILQQSEKISEQKEVLDQLNNTKNQLFSVISHDLRSPFAAILQSIDAIRSGDISATEQTELLDDFYRQVNLVTTMVNNLLAWANSQQEGIKCHPVTLNVTQVVEDIASISGFLAKNKNIFLDHQHNDEHLVFADADHVRIIVQNLVGNAIKFTRKGGVVQISYTVDADFIAIHVKDSGVGIKADKLNKLFKVTGKEISGYGTNNEAGAGIGLALIKQFTDANNGKLDVHSKYGEGSEFIVYLPRA
ncbi:MAG TPA: tetratricopeptide repeat-containing sensor histidine kinase [Mucilaginibacter sp.]|nr:tetratricopeptide repeat-containing sensor histidine kinase [Mucilaginibacter sp.]